MRSLLSASRGCWEITDHWGRRARLILGVSYAPQIPALFFPPLCSEKLGGSLYFKSLLELLYISLSQKILDSPKMCKIYKIKLQNAFTLLEGAVFSSASEMCV